MKVYKLKFKQVINSSLDDVFSFFSNPENLSKITPEKLGFNILTPTPIKMKEGQLIDYSIKLLGKKIRWRTMITEYIPKVKFVDQQLKGPYSMWHHTHEFKDVDGKVEMTDEIYYVMPFGLLGRLVNFLFVSRDLNNIFKHRVEIINKIFDTNYKGK
tara:strand:- start:1867 stop:2337 length:471 start_codon:yes stop_codon:yes gene_type:complete